MVKNNWDKCWNIIQRCITLSYGDGTILFSRDLLLTKSYLKWKKTQKERVSKIRRKREQYIAKIGE